MRVVEALIALVVRRRSSKGGDAETLQATDSCTIDFGTRVKKETKSMAFRRTIARLNRVYRLSERHIAPGYEHKVKDVMDNIKREVVNQPGLISIEVLTEKINPISTTH